MNVHEALSTAAGRIGGLDKTEENRQQGFRFRSIEAITAAVRPVFADLGLSIVPEVLSVDYTEVQSKGGATGWRCVATVAYTVTHREGSEQVRAVMVGEAVDYGDKATSKAIQMAFKYALTQLLVIGSGDDHDGATPEPVSATKPEPSVKRRSKNPVDMLKVELVDLWGKDLAASAWHTLFPKGDPPPSEIASNKMATHVRAEVARIVGELTVGELTEGTE